MSEFKDIRLGMDVGADDDGAVIIEPIEDRLMDFTPVGWSAGGLTVCIHPDGSGEIVAGGVDDQSE